MKGHMMSRRMLPLLAIAGAVIAPVPAVAQSADQDVRCLVASNIFATQGTDAAKKQMAVSAAFFYLGRLGARANPAQLKGQVVAQSKTLNPQTAGPIMTACIREIGAKQLMMQGVGKELQASLPKK
jgi:CHASE2 domain-containing sensor protein